MNGLMRPLIISILLSVSQAQWTFGDFENLLNGPLVQHVSNYSRANNINGAILFNQVTRNFKNWRVLNTIGLISNTFGNGKIFNNGEMEFEKIKSEYLKIGLKTFRTHTNYYKNGSSTQQNNVYEFPMSFTDTTDNFVKIQIRNILQLTGKPVSLQFLLYHKEGILKNDLNITLYPKHVVLRGSVNASAETTAKMVETLQSTYQVKLSRTLRVRIIKQFLANTYPEFSWEISDTENGRGTRTDVEVFLEVKTMNAREDESFALLGTEKLNK